MCLFLIGSMETLQNAFIGSERAPSKSSYSCVRRYNVALTAFEAPHSFDFKKIQVTVLEGQALDICFDGRNKASKVFF